MRENVTALLLLYIRPVAAISRILDHGRLWFAIVVALCVSVVLHAWMTGVRVQGPFIAHAVASWLGFSSLAPLAAIALAFVPAVIFVRAVSGFGSFSVLMRSDYLSLLLCFLMSWSAAYIPFATLGLVFGPALLIPANLYFVILTAFGIRTIFGIGFGPAIGLAIAGCVAAVGGIALSDLAGGLKYYLMSPFLLYYGYSMFGSDVRSLGDGLRGRQHLRQQLELATTNPRDADAHYQLGLVYQKRRQHSEAIARFEKAIEIDPSESEAQFQLGRIAREQGRFDDAIRFLKTAAGLNDKLASSEVWKELGAAYFGASRYEEAAAALAKYTERRSYDPEGLYWYGKALVARGRTAEARAVFDQCVEAVDTMPKHRRAEVRKWKGLAKTELNALKA